MTKKRATAYRPNKYRNPILLAVVRSQINETVKKMLTSAKIQALYGDAPEKLISDAGTLLYCVAHACRACKISTASPDIRILRGLAMTLGQLRERTALIDSHRPAITSGLEAIDRLLPLLSLFALGDGLVEFRSRVAGDGYGTNDIHDMLGGFDA